MSNPISNCYYVMYRNYSDFVTYTEEYKYFDTKDEGNEWFTSWYNDEMPNVEPERYGTAYKAEDGTYKRLTSKKFISPKDEDDEDDD